MTVRIGKPKAERPKLEVGFFCNASYDVEEAVWTSDDTDYRRTTKLKLMFEERPQIDPSLSEQSFTVRVPEDAPFTYRGSAFGFHWLAMAKEKRRWFQSDAGHIATVEVLPNGRTSTVGASGGSRRERMAPSRVRVAATTRTTTSAAPAPSAAAPHAKSESVDVASTWGETAGA